MKTKRILGIFFIVAILCASVFTFGCDNNYNIRDEAGDPVDTVHAQDPKDEDDKNEENRKIYVSSLEAKSLILLSNNGAGIEFIVDYSPINTTEDIYIEIENKDIINFAGEIPLDKRGSLIDFTTEGNILYPLSAGETVITITAKISETEYITKTCSIIVEEYEEMLGIEINDCNGNIKSTDFKSGQKSNGQYEIYTAKISSARELEGKNLQIVSEDIVVLEDSKNYYFENNSYYFEFNFYIAGQAVCSLQVMIDENYLNLEQTRTPIINISSTDFVSEFSVQVSHEGSFETLIEGGQTKYILYKLEFGDPFVMQTANNDGYYTNYVIHTSILIPCGVSYTSSNTSIFDIETVGDLIYIVSKGIGEAVITGAALDGSGQTFSLIIKVLEITPDQLKVKSDAGEMDLLSLHEESDFDEIIGDINVYEQNEIGKINSFELTIFVNKFYVTESCAYFEIVEEEGLTLTIERDIRDGVESRKYIFQAQTAGIYTVNLVVNGEVVYTFNVTVLEAQNHFAFYAEDSYGVDYDFENTTITVNFSICQDLLFYCNTLSVDNIPQAQNLLLSFSDESYVEFNLSYGTIFLLLTKPGTVIFTITEINSGLSIDLTLIINE